MTPHHISSSFVLRNALPRQRRAERVWGICAALGHGLVVARHRHQHVGDTRDRRPRVVDRALEPESEAHVLGQGVHVHRHRVRCALCRSDHHLLCTRPQWQPWRRGRDLPAHAARGALSFIVWYFALFGELRADMNPCSRSPRSSSLCVSASG